MHMQLQALIQSILTLLIPIVGTLLPGILKQDRYPAWLNSLIAGFIVLLAAGATAYTKDQLDFNFVQDAFVIGALIASLLAGPLKDLDSYLQSYISIFGGQRQQQSAYMQRVPVPAATQPKNDIPGPDTSTHPAAL